MSKRLKPKPTTPATPEKVRCAIYTRKSTEEGLEQDFNTLDAQREAAEAYILSQQHQGWEVIEELYDDGGYTGANMDRPALKRLMEDIAENKVDRLSRSLLDFSRILETFEQNQVAFVSVTQQFNTASSMGRLILNVLLSFAQFEREMISERTRDKIAATRRKGKWSGGLPVLGYDVDRQNTRLLVNETEAKQVQQIFELYLETKSLLETVRELDQRGWFTKRWITKKRTQRGGVSFTKTRLHSLLTNVTYRGLVKYKQEIHEGEHPDIITEELWEWVQCQLEWNSNSGGAETRNQFGALLKGLLYCTHCGCGMSPSHSTKPNGKRYRYYVCSHAQKRGWDQCPSKSIPAGEIEQFDLNQIQQLASDPVLIEATIEQGRTQVEEQLTRLEQETERLQEQTANAHRHINTLLNQLVGATDQDPILAQLADLQDQNRQAERWMVQLREVHQVLEPCVIEPETAFTLKSGGFADNYWILSSYLFSKFQCSTLI